MSSTSRRPKKPSASLSTAALPDEEFGALWFWLLVLLPVLFNAVLLAPELASDVPSRNDSALHSLMMHGANDALQHGFNLSDFWIPQLDLGFPQFLYYQHLPHLLMVAVHRALFGAVSLDSLLHGSSYLLLVTFPLTVAWSARRMEFSATAAAFAALAASLLTSSDGQYGFEYESYLWRGLGLYTQLWAMHLSVLSLAVVFVAVREGKWHVRAGLLLSALLLSHVLYGAMTIASSGLLVLVGAKRHTVLPRVARLAVPALLALVVTAHFWWPFMQSGFLYVSSRPDLIGVRRYKRDDVSALLHGIVFDGTRLPIFSLTIVVGACFALVKRTPARLFALYGLAIWLLIYLDPPSGSVRLFLFEQVGRVFFRAVGPVHIFGILLLGVAGEALYVLWGRVRRATGMAAHTRDMAFAMSAVMLVTPALIERAHYYRDNGRMIADTRAAIQQDRDQSDLLTAIALNRAGRVSAGPPAGWGSHMRVGENSLSDMINARRLPAIGAPFQALSLNSELTRDLNIENAALLDLYDVRTIVLPANVTSVPTFFSPLFRNGRYAAWRVPTSGVTSFVAVSGDTVVQSQFALWNVGSQWIKSDSPRSRTVTRLEYDPRLIPAAPFAPRAGCPNGQISDEQTTSQSVTVRVACANPSALMFKFTYHPNWRVRVDSVETAAYMVTPAFVAVDVPAGEHTVRAEYVPSASIKPLLLIGAIMLALAVLFRRQLDAPARWLHRHHP